MPEPSGPLRGPAGWVLPTDTAVDWAATSLGPVEGWSPALRSAVSLCLGSRFAVAVCWGPDLTMVYNEPYQALLGDKHPAALGSPAPVVFAEAWPAVEGAFRHVLAGGATFIEDERIVLDRHGQLEECWFTSSISPVEDEDGGPAGVLTVSLETTRQVVDRRRLELLRRLGDLSEGLDLDDVARRVLAVLREHPADLPAVDLLLPDAAGLVAVEPAGQLAEALRAGVVGDARLASLAVPLPRQDGRLGALLVRQSTRAEADEDQRTFLTSVARAVSAALSASVTYQVERQRADTQSALAEQLGGVVAVAQLLGAAQSEEDVLRVVTGRGADALGASAAALAVLDPADPTAVRAVTAMSPAAAAPDAAASGSAAVEPVLTTLPVTFPLPVVHTATTGEPLLLPDQRSTLARFPEAGNLHARAGAVASASLPLRVSGRLLGALGLSWSTARLFSAQDEELMRAMAALCAQAVDRVQARAAERASAAAVQRMSETLQRSLLTHPPRPEGLEIAVRYLPASQQAQVGGDWYDAFVSPDGSTSLVIGDVAGHDRDAAAAMGQVRNLLRATAYAVPGSPASVLAALETTMSGLDADTLATAVLAQVGTAASGPGLGARVLRWCNAGHPPPLLHDPAGGVRLLAAGEPDVLLGLGGASARLDAEAVLPVGATLLLYTDGLVERRGEGLDVGLERLRRALEDVGPLPLEQLCDRLLQDLVGAGPAGAAEAADDVALLALRVHPLADPEPVPLRAGEHRTTLPGEPASVARARRFAVRACASAGRESLAEVLALLVSEVVTNAVKHGRGEVRLAVLPVERGLRVEVGDDEPHRPVPRTAREEDEGGRGLALVEALASDWGTTPTGSGKVVWFEVAEGL